MRRLYIDNVLIDIDEKTAIGIDIVSFDVKKPGVRRVKISNSFTIPRTNHNLQTIGYIGGVQSTSQKVYSALRCEYYVNNTQFIKDAKIQVQSVADRIELFVYERGTIWDEMRGYSWLFFQQKFLEYLSVPKSGSEFTGTYSDFLSPYATTTGSNGLILPVCRANDLDTTQIMYLSGYSGALSGLLDQSGAHAYTFLKTIFEFIESEFSINFYTAETFTGNIFEDPVFDTSVLNLRDIYVGKNATGYYWNIYTQIFFQGKYLNTFESEETPDKTLYDLVISIIQRFNLILSVQDDGYKLKRFDNLQDSEVVDFSGNMVLPYEFKPYIDGYGKESVIKFKTVEEGISEQTNAKKLSCNNENIENKVDLITISGFIPTFSTGDILTTEITPNLNTKKSFTDFKIFTIDGTASEIVFLSLKDTTSEPGVIDTAGFNNMPKISLLDMTGEYLLLDEALNYPIYYEVKKWMNSNEIRDFDQGKQYYIRELNGAFYVNNIKGFNPELSKQPVTIELIKISDATPSGIITEEVVWLDGVGDNWQDGTGDNWTTN
jgi:hypothetical protein